MTYSYIKSEPGLWTVGIRDGSDWEPESDHDSIDDAIARVRYLNGGDSPKSNVKEVFVPTRHDFYLQAAFQGILANPDFSELPPSKVARSAIDHTKQLLDRLDKQTI